MTCRDEAELDSVTLHNSALVHMNSDPGGGFRRLNYLLELGQGCPRPTLRNLLLLYLTPGHGFLELAADLMAEHTVALDELLDRVSALLLLLPVVVGVDVSSVGVRW